MQPVPAQIQNHLNDQILMQMNPNLNIMNPANIPQIIPNQQNMPVGPINPMGLQHPVQNNPPKEDTSKISFLI